MTNGQAHSQEFMTRGGTYFVTKQATALQFLQFQMRFAAFWSQKFLQIRLKSPILAKNLIFYVCIWAKFGCQFGILK